MAIGLSNWDTSKVTNMSYMFAKTRMVNVDALAAGKNNNPNIWNTGNVEAMDHMFEGSSSLMNVTGLSNWNTENVTNMDSLFRSCSSLADITGLSNWDTSKVVNMATMFHSTKIANLDALNTGKNGNPNIWNTGSVTNMSYMFYNCTSLTDITGLSYWDTSKVTTMESMFSGYYNGSYYYNQITNLDALEPYKNNNPNIWNTGNVTNMSNMFFICESLIDITGISNWDTSKVTSFYRMFYLVPSTTTSGFSFTSRPGTITGGTYVPSS